ncbi:MAG: FHA domain-containing protein [Anaerolineales bacterium]|nr:FHA domain-containing protein [Anaerolineales bacterium]
MDLAVVLLLLRLLSAGLLLAFLGAIAWLIYRDLQLTTRMLSQQDQVHGYLVVIANDAAEPALHTRFPLAPVTSIGRAPRNTVVLNNGYASGEHALLSWRGGQWWLEDLGSRNGTLLNEAPLTDTAVVSAGDVISVGGTQLKLET